jgi:NAD dependent epimerase/dehydratase family enzyme
MADEMLLSSQRVQPLALQGSGFQFKYPELRPALESML